MAHVTHEQNMCYALKSTYNRLMCDTEYAVAPAGIANRNGLKPQHNRFYHGEDNRRWDTTVGQEAMYKCASRRFLTAVRVETYTGPQAIPPFSIHLRSKRAKHCLSRRNDQCRGGSGRSTRPLSPKRRIQLLIARKIVLR